MRRFPRALAVDLTRYSGYFALTFKEVVEHTYEMVFSKGKRQGYAKTALDILVNLVKKTPFPFVDAVWIDNLLKSASSREMDDEVFNVLLRLSALRRTDEAATESKTTAGHDDNHIGRDEAEPGGIVTWENQTPEYALLKQVLRIVDNYSALEDGWENGWEDDAVYGGLIALKDIPGLWLCDPQPEFIRTLSKAMEKQETEGETKPPRVREAAYDVVFAVRDRWLRSADLHPTLEAVDFPRKLHSVAIESPRSDHQRSFLKMIEILSKDGRWHPYLRKAMDICYLCITRDRTTRF